MILENAIAYSISINGAVIGLDRRSNLYSILHLEEIYSAIAYYLNHRQEIDNYLEQRRQKAQQQRSKFVKQYNLTDLRERLSDRYQTQKN